VSSQRFFYYQENLELLEAYGAECLYFSPLNGETIPEEANGLYIGGGFPEQFAEELSDQGAVNQSIKNRIEQGMPTLAECGGFMYLADSIEMVDGKIHHMVGAIPGKIKMAKELAAIGYREITGLSGNFLFNEELRARGHEYHYSSFHSNESVSKAYHTKGSFGDGEEGYLTRNLIAGYTHIHFASCPELVENFIQKCMEMKKYDSR
jgi:cobyrinic acid a,c-diamide synthase